MNRWSYRRRLVTTVFTAMLVPLASYAPAALMAAKAQAPVPAPSAVALNNAPF